MNKLYVFIPFTISRVGGAQLYIKNKTAYLEQKGWRVLILQSVKYKMIIEEFQKSTNHRCFYEFNYPPSLFSSNRRNKTLNRIQSLIAYYVGRSSGFQIIIESHSLVKALWGELIAERNNCKHIVYLLQESFAKLMPETFDFLDFKHQRKELAGIHKKSLAMLFNRYKTLNEDEQYFLRAGGAGGNVEDVEHHILNRITKKDLTIGSITRLSKPYVIPFLHEVVSFAKNNPAISIQLILIGGAARKRDELNIRRVIRSANNLSLIITGFLHPIPRKIIKQVDLFVSVSGAAGVSAREGVLTMTLDVLTFKPIGLLGVNTDSALYIEKDSNDSDHSISSMLENVLIDKKLHLSQNMPVINIKKTAYEKIYQSHLDFIYSGSSHKDYYVKLADIKSFKDKMRYMLMFFISPKYMYKFRSFFRW